MRSFEQIRTVAAARLAAESGMAVPVVLAALVIGLSLGSAAVLASVQVQSGSIRDEDSKAAIAAADAAVAEAVFRQNKVPTAGGNRCLVLGAGATLIPGPPAADGWCPAVSGTVGTASWTYRVRHLSPVNGTETMEVVGTGTSDGVSRRVEVQARTENGGNPFSTNAVVGRDFINLESNAHIEGNAATNGDITIRSSAELCGTAQIGTEPADSLNLLGSGQHGGSGCPQSTYPVVAADTTLAPVFQGFVPSVNSNGRFFSQDLSTGSGVTWNSATRTLNVGTNSTLTLGGANYSFCRLHMDSNSTIYIAAGADVRIFFDTPESCNQTSGIAQMELDSNTRIVPSSGNPAHAAFLFVGSTSTPPLPDTGAAQQQLRWRRRELRELLRSLRTGHRPPTEQQLVLVRGNCRQVGPPGFQHQHDRSGRCGRLPASRGAPLPRPPLRRVRRRGDDRARSGLLTALTVQPLPNVPSGSPRRVRVAPASWNRQPVSPPTRHAAR